MEVFIKLSIIAIIFVVISVILCILEKYTKFAQIKYIPKQIILGIIFGILAICGTEFGVDMNGAVINVRDSAPLCAGLIFGGPAGIISGIIGGIERMLAVQWGAGAYTAISCTISTILAGLLAAFFRRFILSDKAPTWIYAMILSSMVEASHMLMVFITHMDDIAKAYEVVKNCIVPMELLNAISVTLAVILYTIISKQKLYTPKKKKKIGQAIQLWLFAVMVVAFIGTSFLTYSMQTNLARNDVEKTLSRSISDIKSDIHLNINDYIYSLSYKVIYVDFGNGLPALTNITEKNLQDYDNNNFIDSDDINSYLDNLTKVFGLSEINIINTNGIIQYSNVEDYIGFDMTSQKDDNKQASEFYKNVKEKGWYVQQFQANSYYKTTERQYSGFILDEDSYLCKKGGCIQIGYNDELIKNEIESLIPTVAESRRVGSEGFVFICKDTLDNNGNYQIIGMTGKSMYDETFLENEYTNADLNFSPQSYESGKVFEESIYNIMNYCMYEYLDGYYLIATIPQDEAMQSRNISVLLLIFIEYLVFSLLFVLIFILINKHVVKNIQKISNKLSKISDGNLDVTVDVQNSEEFISLSNDINTTVKTLKNYISEAEERINHELELAKTIQYSALPCVFPPYPERKDFEIYAKMYTAKEVGGDFYDFYLLDENRLAFLMADVSGKGISAALFMMKAKTVIKGYAERCRDVAEILTHANNELCENNDAEMFVTCWMGILDFRTHIVTFANAGHCAPLVRHKDGTFEYFKVRTGMVLASIEDLKYQKGELELLPGDEIFLYTDGVTEATDKNNKLYGENRLLSLMNSLSNVSVEEYCFAVKADIDKFIGDAPQFDDITMLCLRLLPINVFKFKPTADIMPNVINFVEQIMKNADLPKNYIAKINVVIDEICSNIIYYSEATEASVECIVENEEMVLIFTDNGKSYNPLEVKEPDITLPVEDRKIGGLGIFLVKQIMDKIHYCFDNDRNILTLLKNIDI